MHKFAIIGCGRIARRHADIINKVGKLIAVCDSQPEHADRMAAEYNARVYYSINELLATEKDIDIVTICTPNGLHAEHIIKSLQAGKHVLCEKPLCLTSAAAWQIIETEKFFSRKLFVVKSSRYMPLLKQLKELISQNRLGRLYSFHLSCLWNRPADYYKNWRGKLFPDGGTLYTQFSHYIDALLWIFGEIKEVKGYRGNLAHQGLIEFEDTGTAALEMSNGILGSLHWSVNTFQKNFEIGLTVMAEKGTLRIGGEYLNELQYQQTEADIHLSQGNAGSDQNKNTMSHHEEVYRDLITELQNNSQLLTGVYDGLRTVEAIEKIYKAIA